MGRIYIGLLVFAAITGFQAWPYYWSPALFIGYWAIFLKLMPEEDRRLVKSARGVIVGMFVGRALVVIAAWGLGFALRGFAA